MVATSFSAFNVKTGRSEVVYIQKAILGSEGLFVVVHPSDAYAISICN